MSASTHLLARNSGISLPAEYPVWNVEIATALSLRGLQPKSIIPASSNVNNLAMSPVGIHPLGIPGRISPFGTLRLQRHGLQTQSAIPGDTLLSEAVTSLVTDDPRISFPAWNTEIASTLFLRGRSPVCRANTYKMLTILGMRMTQFHRRHSKSVPKWWIVKILISLWSVIK